MFRENHEFKWIPKTDILKVENNGRTLVLKEGVYVTCEEKKKVLVYGTKNSQKLIENNENQIRTEYKWKLRIKTSGYVGVGFIKSDHNIYWDREFLDEYIVSCCKKNLFTFFFFKHYFLRFQWNKL